MKFLPLALAFVIMGSKLDKELVYWILYGFWQMGLIR